jgi:hypothetical protein
MAEQHVHDGAEQCMNYRQQVKRDTFAQRFGAGRPQEVEKFAQAVAEAIAPCGDAIRARKEQS